MHLSNFGLIINYMETGGKRQWNADNSADTARQCKLVHGRETKAEKSRLSGFVTHIYIYIYIWRNLKNKQEKIVNVSDKLLILQKIN